MCDRGEGGGVMVIESYQPPPPPYPPLSLERGGEVLFHSLGVGTNCETAAPDISAMDSPWVDNVQFHSPFFL